MEAARVLDVLALARALVESGWCQDQEAANLKGWPTAAEDSRARAYCALGGLRCAIWELEAGHYEIEEILQATCEAKRGLLVDDFNDAPATTKRQVLALFDHAAARVGKG